MHYTEGGDEEVNVQLYLHCMKLEFIPRAPEDTVLLEPALSLTRVSSPFQAVQRGQSIDDSNYKHDVGTWATALDSAVINQVRYASKYPTVYPPSLLMIIPMPLLSVQSRPPGCSEP